MAPLLRAGRLKASGHAQRCFIYHNHMMALEWLESQRAVMYDNASAHWFLQYTDGDGNKTGRIYAPNAWEVTKPSRPRASCMP
eukprot:COSAG04_NODE_3082_length_3189_cov_1.949191_2_plen_83_part_00